MKFKHLFSLSMVIILALAGSLWQPAAVSAGSGWLPVGLAGFSAYTVDLTSLALDSSGNPYVAFADYAYGGKVTVMKYNGAAWEIVGAPGIGISTNGTLFINLALDHSNTPYVAYQDVASVKAVVMKFNGAAWVPVGPATGLSGGQAFYLSLALDSSGTPYLAYQDCDSHLPAPCKATVMKFNDSNWEPVGPRGFTSRTVSALSLKLDKNNIPYMSYRDGDYNGASVMKYSGGAWAYVGSSLFSGDDVSFTSLALDSNNRPLVAYIISNTGKPTVKRYNGSAWELVGSTGFSLAEASYPSLALDSSDTPYVAYQELLTPYISGRATVMKLNGSAWVAVGTAGFSPSTVNAISLALDSSGIPYVSYDDGNHSNYATVMKYYPVLPPTDFSKTGPSNAATDVTPNPILSWGASSEADSYEYCFDTTNNNGCDSSWISTGARTSVSLTGLKTNTAYYWQVRAVNTGGTTYADTSTWGSFSTGDYKVFLPFMSR